ncbi:MAG: hypothetical protein CFE37_05570 [Alphaproteobacteria bacterium PA4]|nr:MAG: hypothetical protein CFE37_05570 [Alphaproteobacteria bacterium PA4]
MTRLLACQELGLGLGHLNMLAPVAGALSVLGHDSWLAVRDLAAAKALPCQPFARTLQAPIWLGSRLTLPALTLGQVYADGGFADDEALVALVGGWLALFELIGPGAIYTEHAPAALLAAHVAGLPAARIGTPFTCPPASRPMPALMPDATLSVAERAAADAVADRVIRAVCRHYGAPVLGGLWELLDRAPAFLASLPALESPDGRRDTAFYGPLSGIGAAAVAEWPDTPGPRIFVYIPFDRPMAAPLAQALATRGWPVIWMCSSAPTFPLPGTIAHEREPLDPALVLADSVLAVTRGGHGLALDALTAGCPQLLLPDRQEAQCHAWRLAAQGLGHIAPAWDAATLGDLLDAMVQSDAPERAAARAMAATLAGHDPQAATQRLARDMAQALRLD